MNHTKTILVIDDEPGYRALLECDLTALGYRVHVAAGGPEALTLLESISIDLVITDMRMSPLDGLQIIILLKEKHPSLPVILMTGYSVEDRVRRVLEFKPSSYLKKPFDLDAMRSTVSALLEVSG